MSHLKSVRDTAAALGVSIGTLANWRVAGKGPRFVRVGGRKIAYREEDIAAFIEAGLRSSTSEEAA